MYPFLVDASIKNRVNKNIVAAIGDGEYNNVLLENKCLWHSMKVIQNNIRIGNYEINKLSLLCFDEKIYVLKMDIIDQFLVIRVKYEKNSNLNDYSEQNFCLALVNSL